MGELPADGGTDQRHLLGRAEPVEPRHQRGVQGCGNRQGRGRNRRSGPPRFAFALGLQHRLRHLLHEQRNAVGALDNILANGRWDEAVPRDAVDHVDYITLPQPIDGERGYVRLPDPRRLELRPERHEKQHAQRSYPVDHPIKHFQALQDPVLMIFEDADVELCARSASSLSSFSHWGSLRVKRAARSNWLMIGKKALSVCCWEQT